MRKPQVRGPKSSTIGRCDVFAQESATVRMFRLFVSVLMLAAGLTAVTFVTSAQPAQADGGYTISLPASGGNNNGAGGSSGWSFTGSGSSGGAGVSEYKVRSKWDDRIDLSKRGVPSPMGFYTSPRFDSTLMYDGSSVTMRNAVGWAWQGQPCRADAKNVNGITVYPTGMDWTQRVRWQYIGRWYGAMESAFAHVNNCVNETTAYVVERKCPIKAYDSTLVGPFNTPGNRLPALEAGGEPRNVPIGSAPSQPLPPAQTNGLVTKIEDGKAVTYTTFGELFTDKARWDALGPYEKVRDTSGCGDLRADYQMPASAAAGDASVVGNYQASTTGVSMICRWSVTNPFEMKYTNPNSTGVGSFEAYTQQYGRGDGYRGVAWLGCDPVETVKPVLTKNVTCNAPGAGGAGGALKPFTVRNGLGGDFAAEWEACTGTPVPPEETGEEALEAQCVVPEGQSSPTITTLSGTAQSEETSAGNGTTVMADGKNITVTWPSSVLEGPRADTAKNERTKYTLTGGGYAPGITGLSKSDPFESNVNMDGGLLANWGVPLELQFFKAGSVARGEQEAGVPVPVKIEAERYFDFTKLVQKYRINLQTNEVFEDGPPVETDVTVAEPCRYSAEFYVATVHSTN